MANNKKKPTKEKKVELLEQEMKKVEEVKKTAQEEFTEALASIQVVRN